MNDAKRWTVVVDIDEVDGAVRAVARLHDQTSHRLVAEGVARVGPIERVAPVAGPEVAVARALLRLSERLATAAKCDYDDALERTAHPVELRVLGPDRARSQDGAPPLQLDARPLMLPPPGVAQPCHPANPEPDGEQQRRPGAQHADRSDDPAEHGVPRAHGA